MSYKKEIKTNHAPAAIGPYAQAIVANGMLYCSGVLGIDPATGSLAMTIDQQMRQLLNNLQAILSTAGCSAADVVKTTVFLKSMSDFAVMNEMYSQFFVSPFPARSTIEVARLPKDALVEIECIAICR